MIKLTEPHSNRTGIAAVPDLAQQLLRTVMERGPEEEMAEAEGAFEVRMDYAREGATTGTMPPITTLKGAGKTLVKSLRGNLELFVDKLGERLAFERSGVRFYELLLEKQEVHDTWRGGPTRDVLEEIRDEELQHFLMLRDALEKLGADPTAVTPSANLMSVSLMGVPHALADARTDLIDGLEVILTVELVDNDSWSMLTSLAGTFGEDDLAAKCEAAFEQEERHLTLVRGWLKSALGTTGKPELTPLGAMHPSRHAASQASSQEARPAVRQRSSGGNAKKRGNGARKRSST